VILKSKQMKSSKTKLSKRGNLKRNLKTQSLRCHLKYSLNPTVLNPNSYLMRLVKWLSMKMQTFLPLFTKETRQSSQRHLSTHSLICRNYRRNVGPMMKKANFYSPFQYSELTLTLSKFVFTRKAEIGPKFTTSLNAWRKRKVLIWIKYLQTRRA